MSLTDAIALFIYALLLCDAIAIVAAVAFSAITIVFGFMSSSPSHGYAMLKDMATISALLAIALSLSILMFMLVEAMYVFSSGLQHLECSFVRC